jgi:hypothetical protein
MWREGQEQFNKMEATSIRTQAHAEALAEALREAVSLIDDLGVTRSTTRDKARAALAKWEKR